MLVGTSGQHSFQVKISASQGHWQVSRNRRWLVTRWSLEQFSYYITMMTCSPYLEAPSILWSWPALMIYQGMSVLHLSLYQVTEGCVSVLPIKEEGGSLSSCINLFRFVFNGHLLSFAATTVCLSVNTSSCKSVFALCEFCSIYPSNRRSQSGALSP